LFEQLHSGGAFDSPSMPRPAISIDTSICTPAQAAAQIVAALGLRNFSEAS
jgi:hypothetical protein